MTFVLPYEEAFEQCRKIQDLIFQGKLVIESVAEKQSLERSGQGVMLGVMVALEKDSGATQEIGTVRKHVLACISGVSKRLSWNSAPDDSVELVDFIVPPEEINSALSENDREIHGLTDRINCGAKEGMSGEEIQSLKKRRTALCNQSLEKVYDLYSFHCSDRTIRSLKEICMEWNGGRLPPTGTGECCAPKLFDFAYSRSLVPVSLAETFISQNQTERSLEPVPPCSERCGIILPAMMGLEILYQDKDIVVVNKQSGLLSVPGRGPEKQDSISYRVRQIFPQCIEQPSVHRLDMETSGIMVLSLTMEAHRELVRQFEMREVEKTYVALLDGVLAKKGIQEHGQMELYFRVDIDNRPHQIWDTEYGKKAITEWQILGVEKYQAPDGTRRDATRVRFFPHTGRTHQLRLASADIHGFGVPIIGDTLYGKCDPGERLLLHAEYLRFTHPTTGRVMEFHQKSRF